ncbi:MAG: GAF domain-containing sensor histidine kinase [Elusimicrobia bacterium]|nr:GAF domain-containing sensor histidine kinase [Elusimicrobiota bacterium]
MNDKFQLLLDANNILTSTLDISKLLSIIMELARKVVNADASSLLLIDENTGELYFDVAIGEKADEVKRVRLKSGEGIAGWCAAYNRSLVIEDVAQDSRWTSRSDDASGFKTKSIICAPMRYKGKVLGVIEGINSIDKKSFNEDDLPFFEAFANQSAIALENARLFTRLIQEKEKISAAFNGMTEAVFVTDKDGIIIQSNKYACNLINSEDINGSFFYKIMNDIGFNFSESFLQYEGQAKVFELTRKSEKQVFLSCMVTKITNEINEITGYIFVIRDITEEKKEELLKRTFLSLVSHKLKTPLVTITGYIPILMAENANSTFKKAIESMKKQTDRLADLVEDLLRFTEVESEVLKLEKRENVVDKIISEAVESMKMKFSDKKATVNVADLTKLGNIIVDKEKVKEAIGCILENAVKFNKSPEKIINISGELKDNMVMINIEDNGVGISLSEKEKIFEKFYQIEESFTGQVEGAGLGLALAMRIIESHGGSINVISKLGIGSKFTITFPKS